MLFIRVRRDNSTSLRTDRCRPKRRYDLRRFASDSGQSALDYKPTTPSQASGLHQDIWGKVEALAESVDQD